MQYLEGIGARLRKHAPNGVIPAGELMDPVAIYSINAALLGFTRGPLG